VSAPVICKQCGAREVEAVRRLWATPVCFDCVPMVVAPDDAHERNVAAQHKPFDGLHKTEEGE
jgi:hypothetical protein